MRESKWLGWTSLGISVVSLVVALAVGVLQGWGGLAGATTQTAAQFSGVCLDWAGYVRQEQADPAWGNLTPAIVDSRIDRSGQVLFSRVMEEFQPTRSTRSAVQPRSIGELCGSAHEFRVALTSDEPMSFPPAR
ncbi:hypothetical protein GCM10027517_20910 [Phycicoccus ginsengisoli]